MEPELGQQTVEFSALVRRATEESYLALKDLVEKYGKADGQRSDSEKKIDLLKFIARTRQRMLRLRVVAKWCHQVPLVQYCQQLASTLSSHDTCFTQTADSLFYMHDLLQQARAPIFDVPSAIEIFLTGSYQRLPKCIEDLGIQGTLSEDEQKHAMKKLDTLVRSKLLEMSLPKEMSNITVRDGTATFCVNGEFKVLMTLGYRGHLSLWRILHLELLVGEKNGPIKLEESRRYAIGDDLERRMAAAENPFGVLYTILHELCVALVMDTVLRQVQVLRQGRWKDAIRFELISDGSAGQSTSGLQVGQDTELDTTGLKTPGLKIIYWLYIDKSTGASDVNSCPFIKIEPGHDMQIKCVHSSFVLDPLTDKEASFSLDQSCIDVEKLLLRAIACNRHTRLLEIQRELIKNVQICRGSDDIMLNHGGSGLDTDLQKKDDKLAMDDSVHDEVLRVRAYGASYITLGVNIRNGRFVLQSSKTILPLSTLVDCEDSLNQGSLSATEVFTILRSKSILNLFASTGRFLGMQVYDQSLTTLKIPKSILHGTDFILMGFPQCANSYYLLMQVDEEFKPVFILLESLPVPDGVSPHSASDATEIIRYHKIDVSQMKTVGDEFDLSLFNYEKIHALPNIGAHNQVAERGLVSEVRSVADRQLPGHYQSSFLSLVDEVFEHFENSGSGPPPTSTHQSSSFRMLPTSHPNSNSNDHQVTNLGVRSPSVAVVHQSQTNNVAGAASGLGFPSNNLKLQNNSANPLKSSSVQNLSSSRSYQDFSATKSSYPGHYPATDEDQARYLNEPLNELTKTDGGRPVQVTSPLICPPNAVQGSLDGAIKASMSSALILAQTSKKMEASNSYLKGFDSNYKHEKDSRKRSLADFLLQLPSFERLKSGLTPSKKRKMTHVADISVPSSFSCELASKPDCIVNDNLLGEPKHELTPSNLYIPLLLMVVRHCSVCIKHAQLTSQMDSLGISYDEDVGVKHPSSNMWLRLPFARDDPWKRICLRLGKPGTMCWDVKIDDPHFRELWELQKGSTSTIWGPGVRIANTSEVDSHIRCDSDGVVLSYKTVEASSIKRLIADLLRLYNARLFACGMRKIIGLRADDKIDDNSTTSDSKLQLVTKGSSEAVEKLSEQIRTFKIDAVGLMSLWFSYGTMPVLVNFVVEWENGKEGCTMHVSPDQLWPHTKFLEDFINGGEVASFLDCVRLTAGPLLALCGAIRPARIPVPVSTGHPVMPKQNNLNSSQGLPTVSQNVAQSTSNGPAATTVMAQFGSHSPQAAAVVPASGRGGPGIVPSSLLPFDVSVVLRGPYWIRIIYRKNFSVDMRCFAGDQVWLQPATPPKGGPAFGGSLPCPQFRPFIMEHVAQGLNALEPNFPSVAHSGGQVGSNSINPSSSAQPMAPNPARSNATASGALSRPTSTVGSQAGGGLSRVGPAMLASPGLAPGISGMPLRIPPGASFPMHVKGELNTAFIGLGDDGGYGGGWVPLAALKKVLRGILKYLGVLWLFAQLPDLLKEILGSILKENEGALLNLDQEQPALRFYVGGYVFAVSVHRVQLLLQVLSVKRFQQQQQQNQVAAQEELTPSEISEICDYFSRRVASEPYDASRVASFITLLTLPIFALREFLKMISWKKGLSQAHGGDIATAQRSRIELCLENHSGSFTDNSESSSGSKSNIHHDRANSAVDFALTFVLDHAHIPHMNAAGGAAWLPYCISVRLKYSFGETSHVSFLGVEGSHGGRACWSKQEDWEKFKQRMAKLVEYANGNSVGDASQGRLRLIAETLQRNLQNSLQHLRESALSSSSN